MLDNSRHSSSKQTLTLLDRIRRAGKRRIVKSAAKLKRRGRCATNISRAGRTANGGYVVAQHTFVNTQKGGYLRRGHHLPRMVLYLCQ